MTDELVNESAPSPAAESATPPEPPGARILVVDDHDLARAGLISVLESIPGVHVVGQAASAEEALLAIPSLRPELVLMDIRMPGKDGLAATRTLTSRFRGIRVMIVTFWETPHYVLEAYQAGAVGYISKGAPRAELVAEIERVLRGESLVGSALARRVLDQQSIGPSTTAAERVESLSPRLRQVLALVAVGLTNPEIAERLGSSPATVKTQVERIFRRLGVDNRTKAASLWIVAGLPAPDDPPERPRGD